MLANNLHIPVNLVSVTLQELFHLCIILDFRCFRLFIINFSVSSELKHFVCVIVWVILLHFLTWNM